MSMLSEFATIRRGVSAAQIIGNVYAIHIDLDLLMGAHPFPLALKCIGLLAGWIGQVNRHHELSSRSG
jgi:hypothetical protein